MAAGGEGLDFVRSLSGKILTVCREFSYEKTPHTTVISLYWNAPGIILPLSAGRRGGDAAMATGGEHRKGTGNAGTERMHMAEEWREAGGSFRSADPFSSRMGLRAHPCVPSPCFYAWASHEATRPRIFDSAPEEIP